MNRRLLVILGLGVSSLVVALQYVVALGLVVHSYTLRWKAGQLLSVSIGNSGTALWFIGSLAAIAYCFWAFRWLRRGGLRFRFAALGLAIASAFGVLALAGMLASGLLQVVQR